MSWKFFVEHKPWNGRMNLRIGRRAMDGIEIVQQFVFKKYSPGYAVPDDEIALSGSEWGENDVREFLQGAADAAWELGIRPAGAKDQTNELKAIRDHLADMRTLAMPKTNSSGL